MVLQAKKGKTRIHKGKNAKHNMTWIWLKSVSGHLLSKQMRKKDYSCDMYNQYSEIQIFPH